jgi:selenocysteine lyase/cysteine desulfurase
VPDRLEAGTPAIINVIAFAKALQLIQMLGNDVFLSITTEKIMATQILHNDDLKEYSGQELLNKLRHTLLGKDIRVPTAEGLKPYINFDNGASTPTFKPIWDVVWQIWRQPMQVQQGIIPEVKSVCANALGAPEEVYDIILTSNTTESINLLAGSLSTKSDEGIETVVINTILEHNSNELPWRMMPGCSQIRLSIDSEGFIDLDELESLLSTYNQKNLYGKKRIKLVAISGASNVLGTFNDLSEICRITHFYGAQVLVDGAQLVAHRKIEMEKCGIDYLAFSAHKVYAPFGTGVLIARKGLLNFSSSEIEKIKSSGEENIGGIAALGKALILLQRIGFDLIKDEEQALTARALCGITQIPGVTVYGIKNKESPRFDKKSGVIVFDLKGIFANTVAKELANQGGIGVRYGCHCAHMLVKHLVKIPPIVERIQHLIVSLFPQLKLPGITRVSIGIENSEENVDTLIHVLNNIAKKSKNIVSRKVTSTDIKQQMDDSVKITTQRVYHQLS